jgi:hypothetical protein
MSFRAAEKTPTAKSFVSGHDVSRAENSAKINQGFRQCLVNPDQVVL